MDSLHGIVVFLRVVEQGSLSAAARTLGISTSAVSASIARLERRLSVPLLHRTTRRVSVTAEGAEYYNRCKRIVAELKRAELAVVQAGRVPCGNLRVSVPSALGRMWIIPRLPEFVREYPEIRLEVVHTDFVPYTMEDGLDVSVQIGALHDSRLSIRRLACTHYVICASPDYCAQFGTPRTPDDLQDHRCLTYRRPRDGRLWEWRFGGNPSPERIAINGFMTFNSNEAIAHAAAAGLGIANIAEYYARPHIDRGRLVTLLDDYRADGYTISAVFPKRPNMAPKVRVFIDFLVRLFSTPPWKNDGEVDGDARRADIDAPVP